MDSQYECGSKFVFRHLLHIKLWDWLARNPGETKFNWPGWTFNGGNIKMVPHSCFACDYNLKVNICYSNCNKCPFQLLPNAGKGCLNGLFLLWESSTAEYRKPRINEVDLYSLQQILKGLAIQIRDFPVRSDVLTDWKVESQVETPYCSEPNIFRRR